LTPSIEADKINQLLKSIRPDGSWPGINYTDTSRTGFQHRDHLENMLDLARAYKKPGSEFYNKPELIKASSACT
jgi:chondroitin AC lyase